MEAPIEIEEVSVYLPAIGSNAAGPDPGAIGLEDHPGQGLEGTGSLLPSDLKGVGEDVDMKVIHGG